MEFKEFTKIIEDNIKNYLPSRFQDAEVSVNDVIKNNGLELSGLNIRCQGEDVVPCIYLNSYYEEYQEYEMSISDVCKRVAEARLQNEIQADVKNITSPEYVKKNVFFKAVSAEYNQEILQQVPYTVKNDLLITYHVSVDVGNTGCASYRLKNELMEKIGYDKDTLHEFAMKNTPELFPPKFTSMKDIMMEYGMPMEMIGDIPSMYILMDSKGGNGASAMFYPGVLDDISKQIGKDLIILPSSVNEVIILPKEENMNAEELRNMVNEVNMTQVEPQEVLSNNVYEYDFRAKVLVPMGDPLYKANVADLKRNGYQLTRSLEKNLESLNKATGKNNTLKDVKELEAAGEASPAAKDLASKITEECRTQEVAKMMQEL